MKVNIKGLVFVGFAAAILSANAMAAGENIVTSQSFTEATYQHKIGGGENADKAVIAGSTAGEEEYRPITSTYNSETFGNNPTNLVTEGVIDSAIAAAANVDNFVVDNLDSNATNKAPSQNAVNSALSGKQNKTTADSKFVVGNSGGTWQSVSSAVLGGTYTTQAVNASTGAVTIDVDATTTLDSADSGEADFAKIPTAGGVKAYVDSVSSSAANSILVDTLDATDSSHALTNAATTTALNGKQDKDTTNVYKVGQNGTWAAVNSAVADSGTHITTTNEADGSVTINVSDTTNVAAGITSSSTSLTEGKAVYEYVQSVTGGTVIPAMGSICSTKPCALVNDSTGLHWRTMATATDSGGACGDLDTTCGVGNNPVETGNNG